MNSITITIPLPLNDINAPHVAALLGFGGAQLGLPELKNPEMKTAKPARAAKPKEAPPKDDAPAVSAAELQAMLMPAVETLGSAGLKAVFAKHGASRFSELKPASYAQVAADLKAAVAEQTGEEN